MKKSQRIKRRVERREEILTWTKSEWENAIRMIREQRRQEEVEKQMKALYTLLEDSTEEGKKILQEKLETLKILYEKRRREYEEENKNKLA